jgi:NADPH2:quinone reductase
MRLTKSMRAAFYEKTGPASEVLQVSEVDLPEPGPGQVRVTISFSGINPTDVKNRGRGLASIDEFQIPHQDGSGVIDAVGAGVDPNRIGERVWVMLAANGNRYGTAAQHCIVNSELARRLPDSISLELGATLGVPAVTAAYCLFADGPIAGENVLISGGAGAVGRAAVQLAKWAGARVFTTVSSEHKAQIATEAGADVVVNYTDPTAIDQLKDQGISRIIEVNLGANLELDLAISQQGMKIVIYAADGEDPVLPRRALMTAGITIEFMLLYNIPDHKLWQAVEFVEAALAQGALTPPPITLMPLTEIVAAHVQIEAASINRVLVTP